MHALEYLVAGLIMIIFISFSSAVIMPNVYIPITHIKEQQLDILAERITDKILLTPGIPHDWQIVKTKPSEFILYPDDVISNKDWNPSGADILGDNDSTTYIYSETKGSVIQLSISDPPPSGSAINIADVTIRVWGEGDGSVTITVKADTYTKPMNNIRFNGGWISITLDKNWTLNEIESLTVSIESEQSEDVYCYELWVVVKCAAPPEGLEPKPLNGFGLALYEEDVRSLAEPYVLDRDKVLRLTDKSLKLDPLEMARSLGLTENSHLKYGFNVVIKPAISISQKIAENVSIDESHNAYGTVHVKAINYEGVPLANANVYSIVVVFCVDQTSAYAFPYVFRSVTDVSGEATIEFDYSDIIGYLGEYKNYTFLYITCVDFYGLRSYIIDSPPNVETPALIVPTEDGITVLHKSESKSNTSGSIHMRGVFGVSLPYITSLTASGGEPKIYKIWVRTKGAESTNVINHGGKEYIYYSLTGVEQDINAIGICFKYTGKFHFYIVSLRKIIGEELNYGTSPGLGGKKTIVVAKRLVRIEGMDYVFEFRMWRMAED
ncbi:hypothetical protein KEJ27_09090 [Candidatus Bathyarchaeota archaeon]|nr:hypothetical protein [Candidatus Bathyarchaeota archaeon]MBS7618339.1 hypothetical protein [Candidatus Bathyarchaeota archaeon]